jgi:hypothetical protein
LKASEGVNGEGVKGNVQGSLSRRAGEGRVGARLALTILLLAVAPAWAIKTEALMGATWEAARTVEDERTYVRFLPTGRAEIISEYDFQLPGQPGKRRGRATTYGKWVLKGNDLTVTYADVRDRLRYSDAAPLAEIGLQGSAPGLKPVGKPAQKSRLRATLWKAPHEYRLKAPEAGAAPAPQKK